MSKIKNRVVLVTGGASGLGKLMGLRALQAGAQCLVIWDVNESILYETAAEFQAMGYEVYPQLLNVRDTDDMEAKAQEVHEAYGGVDILINNAGVVVGKDFEAHDREEIDRTLEINVSAVMHTTRLFLSTMIRRGRGHIVNIASAAGLIPNPGMSVYVASKWAVLGWSESLRIELERSYANINVTTVTPGYINTGMFEGVSSPPLMPMLSPDEIVEKIIEAIKYNHIHVREPWIVKLAPLLRGLMPARLFDFVVGDMLKVYDSMSTFVGHSHKGKKSS